MRDDELLKYYKVPPEALPATTTYTPISPEERKRRVAELNKRVAENIERLQNSAEFRQYLIAMSRFHNYSWNNQMLIWLQKGNATHVAGYNTWRDLGRYVKSGESGIMILAPLGLAAAVTWIRVTDNAVYSIKRSAKGYATWDNEENMIEDGFPSYAAAARRLKEMGFVEHREALSVNNFKVVHVFDISQTDGKPLPEFDVPALTGEANQKLFDELLRLASGQDVYVRFESKPGQSPSIKGSYEPPNLIWIRPEEAPAQQLNALLHELSHYFTEHVFQIPRRDAETIAECAACVVGSHYGFDTGARSFPYVAVWAREPKTLHANIDTIQKVADKIITELEATKTRLIPMTSPLKEGSLVRMKSGTEGWIKGKIVEYADVRAVPPLRGAIYTGPSYKVYVLEGKHKGETLRFPTNYVVPMEPERSERSEEIELKPGETLEQAARRIEALWKLDQLKNIARRQGVSVEGSKSDIIKRLLKLIGLH